MVVLDLASVETYLLISRLADLASERSGAVWCPLIGGPGALDLDLAAAKTMSERMQLPLIRPAGHFQAVPRTMRVATLAASRSKGARLMLRATRLAWATGADLDALFAPESANCFIPPEEPDGYLAMIAHEISLSLADVQHAAEDGSEQDIELHVLAQGLEQIGIDTAPAVRRGSQIHLGFDAVSALLDAPRQLCSSST
ncbi:MAG: hypothetical protein ACRD6W_13525 [Nitrososphaerales archaeon]